IEGDADVIRAVQTAQLALKHRMNKNQRQRIVLFVGSPVVASEKQLELLGKTLKKNNVSLDIISFGEVDLNSSKLQKLHNAVGSNTTNNLIECPVDASRLLSDILMRSPIVRDSEADDSGAEPSVMNELGVDPTTDPELYMALQMSLQEERNRQAAAAAQQVSSKNDGIKRFFESPKVSHQFLISYSHQSVQQDQAPSAEGSEVAPVPPSIAEIEAMEGIDDELRQALLLSINDFSEPQQEAAPDHDLNLISSESVEVAAGDDLGIIPPNEAVIPVGSDAAREATGQEIASQNAESSEVPSIQQILGTLPGIDMTDPRLLEALQQVVGAKPEPKKDDEKKDGSNQ
ncbi:uncharacterized protein LOC129617716, partial [Condylostylus longicornis]|uniref:uncharacterized protein LOC129617716 n=1 Tax=Condylostylus longicornis TaxID=2530218 RepID=UPI00244DDEA8